MRFDCQLLRFGGPDGELAASLRYMHQRYTAKPDKVKGVLTDIATEELAHVEMISAILYQLTDGLTPEQIKEEFTRVVDLIFSTYKDFGITDYRCVLSLRDPENKEKYHDDDEMWNKAENGLRTTPCSQNSLNALAIDEPLEYARLALVGEMQAWVDV